MKKSIRARLTKSFMIIIIITVSILEIVLSNVIKNYYYQGLEDVLTSQMEYSMDLYSRYYSSLDLDEILLDDVDIFISYDNIQVQLLSLDGEILMDSLGVFDELPIEASDANKVKSMGKGKGLWIGNISYDKYPVMAVSKTLMNGDEPVAIIRFISSLKETNSILNRINILLIVVGIFVISISGLVSVLLSNSIVKPLEEITDMAEKMADGQLKVRSSVDVDDEIGRLSTTLNYMADEILKREEIKNDFISSISHELRTPLTSIKGWAMTLQSDDIRDDDLTLDGLNIIEKESDRLSYMVEELLDFSRFVSGGIDLEKEVFDMNSVLNMMAKQYMPRAKSEEIDFFVETNHNIDGFLGDENRIKQVLINLLDNAFKFTDKGGKIRLSVNREENFIILKISDSGIGIAKEDLPHVKEKFYKGKHSQSQSGIGLSICDEIAKLHDGKLEIESEENKGTIAKVILPIKEEIA